MIPTILIVLGGGITSDLKPNEHTRQRYEKALSIQEYYDVIICSTDKSYRKLDEFRETSEARIGKQYLVKRGVPEEKILLEEKSRDTFSNAYFCRKELIDVMGAQNITILTSEFHMEKTKYVFELVFPPQQYNLQFITSDNGGVDEKQLHSRIISEHHVLNFYKKHLKETYNINPGNMKSIKTYMFEHNPAFVGTADEHHKALTKKIEQALEGLQDPLY